MSGCAWISSAELWSKFGPYAEDDLSGLRVQAVSPDGNPVEGPWAEAYEKMASDVLRAIKESDAK